MTVAVKLPSRNFSMDRAEVETLKTIAVFCGIGLIASLFLAAAGFDVGAGLM